MNRYSFVILLTFLSIANSHAQRLILKPKASSTKLEMQSVEGTNGVAVAYNGSYKKYYAIIAGNTTFPIETFNTSGGKSIHTIACGFDSRGLWYNPSTSTLEGNGYYDYGWYQMYLNEDGTPDGWPYNIFYGYNQPEDQSVGAYDWTNNEVLFYSYGYIYRYDRNTGYYLSSYSLYNCPVDWANINSTTVIYTGYNHVQLGVLDYVNKKIYLFDKETGEYKHTVSLPEDANTTDLFRVSFANDHLWLYDVTTRVWTGYKMFK